MEGQTDGQTLFYRTLLAEARGPTSKNNHSNDLIDSSHEFFLGFLNTGQDS